MGSELLDVCVMVEVFTNGRPLGWDLPIDFLWPDFEVDEDVVPSGTSVCVCVRV